MPKSQEYTRKHLFTGIVYLSTHLLELNLFKHGQKHRFKLSACLRRWWQSPVLHPADGQGSGNDGPGCAHASEAAAGSEARVLRGQTEGGRKWLTDSWLTARPLHTAAHILRIINSRLNSALCTWNVFCSYEVWLKKKRPMFILPALTHDTLMS